MHTHEVQFATEKNFVVKLQGAPKFPNFDGWDSATFRVFIFQFLQLLDIHNFTERDACKMMIACMMDVAVDSALPVVEAGPHTDLHKLMNQLCAVFNAEGNEQIATNLFASCRQRESDTVKN